MKEQKRRSGPSVLSSENGCSTYKFALIDSRAQQEIMRSDAISLSVLRERGIFRMEITKIDIDSYHSGTLEMWRGSRKRIKGINDDETRVGDALKDAGTVLGTSIMTLPAMAADAVNLGFGAINAIPDVIWDLTHRSHKRYQELLLITEKNLVKTVNAKKFSELTKILKYINPQVDKR